MKSPILASLASVIVTLGIAGQASARRSPARSVRPSATTTIDGSHIPPAPYPFGGTINLEATDSTPFWAPKVVPPKGAPNILLIMTDDAGYGVSGTFGGVIPTPALDRIANAGLALHPVPLDRPLLADPRSPDHRAETTTRWASA